MTLMECYTQPELMPASEAARIGMILGIESDEPITDIDLAKCISSGLRHVALGKLSEIIGKSSVVGPVIPEATFRRTLKLRRPLSRKLSERLYEISRVIDAACRQYRGNGKVIVNFLKTPHQLLEGKSPLEMAHSSSAGTEAVLKLLRRAESGFAV